MVVTPGDTWGFFLAKSKGQKYSIWDVSWPWLLWKLALTSLLLLLLQIHGCCEAFQSLPAPADQTVLVLSEAKLVLPLLCLWVWIWGCATSRKYGEQLWCANEDIFAVVDGYQAFVLLFPSLVCWTLLLRLFYCSSGMHMCWHAEGKTAEA